MQEIAAEEHFSCNGYGDVKIGDIVTGLPHRMQSEYKRKNLLSKRILYDR